MGHVPGDWQRFVLGQIAGTPWRNGGGLTREIATGRVRKHAPDAALWDWRISVADIVQAGPFSVFPDTDRQAALAQGRGLQLCGQNRVLQFSELGAIHAFPGEAALASVLTAGPVQLFNVMTRRGVALAEVQAVHRDITLQTPGSCALVALCVRGEFRAKLNGCDSAAEQNDAMHPGHGFTVHAGSPTQIHLHAVAADACLLLARIQSV